MTPEQRERKLATQRECMRRQRERMTPEELEAARAVRREYMRRLRAEEPERARAAERRYDATHKEQRAYYAFCRHLANPEASNARKSAWRKANPERNREANREQMKRARSTPEGREAEARRARRKYIRSVKDKAALGQRIVAAATVVTPKGLPLDIRDTIIARLVEQVYSGHLPIRLTPDHGKAALADHRREVERFALQHTSLDAPVGYDGATLGQAAGIY